MIPLTTLNLFIATSVLLIIFPGPDTLYIMSRSIGHGRWAGVVSALGIGCGAMVHIAAATLGLSVLILSSVWLFTGIKFAGAVYLIWIGINQFRAGHRPVPDRVDRAYHGPSVFLQAFLTNVLNPKVALFFVAILPQFIEPKLGHVPLQIASLGILFDIMGTSWNLGTALLSGLLGDWLAKNKRISEMRNKLTGIALVGLGIRLAFVGRKMN